jgi:hypothetical protein
MREMRTKKYLFLLMLLIFSVSAFVWESSFVLAQTPGETPGQSEVTSQDTSSSQAAATENLPEPKVVEKPGQSKVPKKQIKAKEAEEKGPANIITWLLFGIGLFFMLIFVISSTKIVPQGYTGVVERFGRYIRTEGPGLFLVAPMVSRVRLVNLKSKLMNMRHNR